MPSQTDDTGLLCLVDENDLRRANAVIPNKPQITRLARLRHLRRPSFRSHRALKTKQNTSHAVMAQRTEGRESLDDFPTPGWATRALIEHVVGPESPRGQSCLEPACGRGHMAVVLSEYFREVQAQDVFDYGFGQVVDFQTAKLSEGAFDWVITNPPFRLAENFIVKSLTVARRGVAMLVRTVFIESVGRYERLFLPHPPSRVAQFTERVPMIKGRVDKKASTATGYAWVVWEKPGNGQTALNWVPPCRKALERDNDYIQNPVTPEKSDAKVIPFSAVTDKRQSDFFQLERLDRSQPSTPSTPSPDPPSPRRAS